MRNIEIPKTEKNAFKALAACVSKEKNRPNMNSIYWDGCSFYGTDGKRLMKVTPTDGDSWIGTDTGWFVVNGNFLMELDKSDKTPDYARLIVDTDNMEELNEFKHFSEFSPKGKDSVLYAEACFYKGSYFNPNLFEGIGNAALEWDLIHQHNQMSVIQFNGKTWHSFITFLAIPMCNHEDEPYFTKSSN